MSSRGAEEVRDRPDKPKARHPDRQRAPSTGKSNNSETKHSATARQAARERLRRQDHQRRHARACELARMRMAVHYGPRPLLRVGLGELLTWGRWAA